MVQVQQRILIAGLLAPLFLCAQRFYPDDPLLREPAPISVPKANSRDINEYYDFFQNTFFEPVKEEKKKHQPTPSQAVNTLGEVPDSTWFTNRMGTRPMTTAELVRGPGTTSGPEMDKPWVVLSGKNEGVTPGLVIRDGAGRRYFLKFDPPRNLEMASAADLLGSKFYYALGYNVPENYIVEFDRKQLTLDEKSKYKGEAGKERPMTTRDINDVMDKVRTNKDGRYRALASLSIPGQIIGPFRYYGTRSDDPNDVVPHQNRRDLRGLYVFAAWLNHTDTKSINSLDSVVDQNGIKVVRHHLIDFGAILGSDSFEPKSPRAGNVFLFDLKPAAWQFLSLGLYVPAWMRADYPHLPAVGHLEYQTFDPEHWRNNYPNPAFDLRTPGDTYWAARKVMAFSDQDIRSIVETAHYTNPEATEWVTRCIIERRNRIGRAFFNDVLPLDGFTVQDGKLVFEDLAVKHGFHEPRRYSIQWAEFDNQTAQKRPIPGSTGPAVPQSAAAYLAATILAENPDRSVTVYLRGNSIVGVDRTW